MVRKDGTSTAPSTPRRGKSGLRGNATQEHHMVVPTFVHADVSTFREVVQKLTGCPWSLLPQTPTTGPSNATIKEVSPILWGENLPAGRLNLYGIKRAKPVGGLGPQRTSTGKLFERRQNARKLEVKQLMGDPTMLKCTVSPALSPVSPLTTVDILAEHGGATSPLGYMGYSSAGSYPPPIPHPSLDLEQQPTSPGFDLNSGLIQLKPDRRIVSPRKPSLLTLFPLHSPHSMSRDV